MTEAEIMKALECCVSCTTSEACDGCPLNTKDGCETNSFLLESLSLALINLKNAEIERVTKERDNITKTYTEVVDAWKITRVEAIKEVLEKVKEEAYPFPCAIGTEWAIPFCKIDQIAKEMGVEI